jgi:uncharacterized protein YjcR
MDLVEIAVKLGVSAGTVRGWKSKDCWGAKPNGTFQSEERNVPKESERSKRRGGPPLGSQNAKGNRGGHGGPPGNSKAVKHGFFRKIFPNDAMTQEIIEEINIKSPIEILWENIVIQYTAIARAQRIMHVTDKDDLTKEIKKTKSVSTNGMEMAEQEWNIQFAWDKQANFLQAQSRAISTLESLIARYEEMLAGDMMKEKRELELAKLRAEIVKLKGDEGPTEDDGFMAALEGRASEVWDDDGED